MKGLAFLAALLLTTASYAGDFDDEMGGFEDDGVDTSISTDEVASMDKKPSWLELSGAYTFSTAYNYISGAYIEGFSRLRNKLDLTLDMTFSKNWKAKLELKANADPIYALQGTPNYTQSLESFSEVKEAYVLGTIGSVDLKVGRQIVVWGKSDNIRITDVINPMDNREPGMVDIEDLRLAVAMSKLSFYQGTWSFNIMAIHESRIQYEAGIDSEFFPTDFFPLPGTFPELITPDSSLENTQFAFSADGRFNGWDLSFYAADVLDQRWHLEGTAPNFSREYNKIQMLGIAGNIAFGSWLVKSEVAYLDGLIYNTTTNEKSRVDALIGLEYTGLSDVVLSAEWANRHIVDYEAVMLNAADFVRRDEVTTAMRASYTFDHDNATVTYLLTRFGPQWQDGGFQRFWIDYDLTDSVKLSSGVIDYMASTGQKPFFDAIVDNDRIFFDVKYSF